MTISVVVPLFDKAGTVERSLASILAQTVTDVEVIVVDDGSRDDGPDRVARFRDPRVRLIRQANAGPGAARNRGIAEASGSRLAFLDADDAWAPRTLETHLALQSRHGVAVSAVGYREHPAGVDRAPLWRRRGLTAGVHRLEPGTDPRFAVHLLAFLSPWSTMASAEVVRAAGGFYARGRCLYGEDSYLWLKVLLNHPVAITLEPLVAFHTEASGLSANLGRARPIEPHLTDPAGLVEACPPALWPLLDEMLALRAARTAGMLGSWGRAGEGRALLRRFATAASRRTMLHWAATAATTRPAAAAAGLLRRLPRRARQRTAPA